MSELNQIGKTEIVLQHENDFQQRLGYKTDELKDTKQAILPGFTLPLCGES